MERACPPADRTARRLFYAAFGLSAALALSLIFLQRYLPMVDLPQHAVQLSAWLHYHDPAYGFAQQFELNFRTPYLAGYALARLFSGLGVIPALKVVISLATLGLPLSLWLLLRKLGRDPYWSLVGFPLAFSYSFYFGFVAYLLAIPLYFVAIFAALSHAEQRSLASAARLTLVTTGLFFFHGLLFFLALGTCGLMSLLTRGTLRQRVAQVAPYVVALLVGGSWTVAFMGAGTRPEENFNIWELGPGRLVNLPGLLLGAGIIDGLASIAGVILLAIPWLERPRFSRDLRRYVPFAITLGCALCFPSQLRGVALLAPRFAVLVLPTLLLCLEPRASSPQRAHRIAVVGVVLLWLTVLAARFYGFNTEAQSFDRITPKMARNQRVRPLIFANGSPFVPGFPLFMHFPAYYQAEKGGYLGFSFARYGTSFVRYQPGVDTGMPLDYEWAPQKFSYAVEGATYDYFLVRAPVNLAQVLFRRADPPVETIARQGSWWLYRKKDRAP